MVPLAEGAGFLVASGESLEFRKSPSDQQSVLSDRGNFGLTEWQHLSGKCPCSSSERAMPFRFNSHAGGGARWQWSRAICPLSAASGPVISGVADPRAGVVSRISTAAEGRASGVTSVSYRQGTRGTCIEIMSAPRARNAVASSSDLTPRMRIFPPFGV